MFAPEGWIIADACEINTPVDLFIKAIEDSIVNVYEKNLELSISSPCTLVKRIAVIQKRVNVLMS
jgi:hypothetical protein